MNNRQGLLVVPSSIKPVYVADRKFGTAHIVKKKVDFTPYLFAHIPSKEMVGCIQRKDPITLTRFRQENAYPAILSQFNGGQEFGSVLGELAPGTEVLARAIPGRDDIFEVVTFTKDQNFDPAMPESGRGIEIAHLGYVMSAALSPDKKEHFKKMRGSTIFPNQELFKDINQSIFGDCFLLSSLLGILQQEGGADFIRSMLRQEGDTTVVRFFHPVTSQEVYIRVDNTEYHENNKNTIRHRAPWVHILEKAYTAFAFKMNEYEKVTQTFPAFREIFGKGGKPEVALKILTGHTAREKKITASSPPWNNQDLAAANNFYYAAQAMIPAYYHHDSDSWLELGDGLEALRQDPGVLQKLTHVFLEIQDGSATEIIARISQLELPESFFSVVHTKLATLTPDEQKDYLNGLYQLINKFIFFKTTQSSKLELNLGQLYLLGDYVNTVNLAGHLDELIRCGDGVNSQEEALEYIAKLDREDSVIKMPAILPVELAAVFRKYVTDPVTCMDSEIGVVNSQETSQLLSLIQAALEAKDGPNRACLVAATRKDLSEKPAGLIPSHAYAVLGLYERDGEHYIIVQNPWGHTGRGYSPQNQRAARIDSPKSEIKLRDFVRYFDAVTVGSFTAPPVRDLEASIAYNKAESKSFLQRHGKKILLAATLTACVIVASVFTFGLAGLLGGVAAGMLGGLGLAGVAVPVVAALGIMASAVVGAVVGALGGLFAGLISDARRKKVLPALSVEQDNKSLSSTARINGSIKPESGNEGKPLVSKRHFHRRYLFGQRTTENLPGAQLGAIAAEDEKQSVVVSSSILHPKKKK